MAVAGVVFRYTALCSAAGCSAPAVYKLAAAWSDGTSRELKNYGLSCEAHRASLLAAARRRHDALEVSEGETVGPVELYVLSPGLRDRELVAVI